MQINRSLRLQFEDYNWEPTPASMIRNGGYVKSLKCLRKWRSAGQIPTKKTFTILCIPRRDDQLIVPFNIILTKVDLSTKSGQVYSLKIEDTQKNTQTFEQIEIRQLFKYHFIFLNFSCKYYFICYRVKTLKL